MKTSYIPIQKHTNTNYLWAGFILTFLLAGVIGHDPWKQDETYTFGIIYHFLNTGYLLIPENAGVAFMEKPPLYYWTAYFLCRFLGGLLSLPDCARLASPFYITIAILCVWKTARIIHRDNRDIAWVSLLFFLGTVGIVRHSHDMFTDIALLAGCAMAFYGITLLVYRNTYWKASGLWTGLGIGMAFLSKGMFMPLVLTISLAHLLIMLPTMRSRYTAYALAFGLLVASPFLLIWPALLYHTSPEFFMQWFWKNNVGRFLGFSVASLGADNKPYYIIASVFWFAFPVFPLAVMAAFRARHDWKKPEYLLPVTVSSVGLGLLSISASARALYLLPLIPAFTMLASTELFRLPDKFLHRWNKLMGIAGMLSLITLWIMWLSLQPGHPLPQLLPFIGTIFPTDFTSQHGQWLAIITAAFAGGFFLYIQLRKDDNRPVAAAQIWFCAIAAVWITVNTLLLPWLDETKSYRPVITQMEDYIRHSPYGGMCMNEYHLGESIAPMLEYFSDDHILHTVKDFEHATCPLMLTVTGRNDPEELQPGWKLIWKGSRALDVKDEELRLYVHDEKRQDAPE